MVIDLLSIANIFGFFAFLIGLWRLQLKSVRHIYIADIPKALLWIVHYYLINGISGLIVSAVSIIRTILRLYLPEKHIKIMILLSVIVIWILGLYYYTNIFSLLPLIATGIASYGMVVEERKFYTNYLLIHYLFWLAYGVALLSIPLCLSVLTSILFCIIGKYKHENWSIKRPFQ